MFERLPQLKRDIPSVQAATLAFAGCIWSWLGLEIHARPELKNAMNTAQVNNLIINGNNAPDPTTKMQNTRCSGMVFQTIQANGKTIVINA